MIGGRYRISGCIYKSTALISETVENYSNWILNEYLLKDVCNGEETKI